MVRINTKKITALGIISFLTGFALMAYELVAARILAPTIGSSIYVWTSVIGVIIAALSVGYWLGGKLADARQQRIDVVLLCLGAALGVTLTALTHPPLLEWVSTSIDDTRLQGVVASLLLFAPTSFILGCTSPYLAKLNIKALNTAGESVASLSALNSIGGIVGTFVTGFVFFSYIGSIETLVIVALTLVASSWLLVPRKYMGWRLAASAGLLALACIPVPPGPGVLAQIDSPSAHYEIRDYTYKSTAIVGLSTGPGGVQSAIYPDKPDELVFWYTQYGSKQILEQNPSRILVLGGGAFTVPGYLGKELPNATIDAVEIDPALETIAAQYFNYEDQPNVRLIFEDARAFVNTTNETYDVIFVDVYGDSYIPFSLLTQEYGSRIEKLLNPNGKVIINAIVGSKEACTELLATIDGVYRPFLPHGHWMTESGIDVVRGNYILAYSDSADAFPSMNTLEPPLLAKKYTDNFMPAERLHHQCQQRAY